MGLALLRDLVHYGGSFALGSDSLICSGTCNCVGSYMGIFSFSSKPARQNVETPSTADQTIEIGGCTVTCEDVERLFALVAEGKFNQAAKLAESYNLESIKDSIKKSQAQFQDDLEKTVSLSVNINEASAYGAKLNRIAMDINHRSQGMAAAVEELSASSGSILDASQNASHLTEQMLQNVHEGTAASSSLQQANNEIERVVTDTGEKVEELVRSTEEIHRILRMITEISEKTKLLSLNATIEAARAGEAGKGFAVVASEVKSLAEQTAASADDIKKKVESLTNVTQEISELMVGVSRAVTTGRDKLEANQAAIHNIQGNSEQVSHQMSDILNILRDQDQAVSEISGNVNNIANMTSDTVELIESTLSSMDKAEVTLVELLGHYPSFELTHTTINLAKSDHVIWKKRLYSMAAGHAKLDPNSLADHKSCRLGKWYYSDASSPYKNLQAFKDIEKHHIEVHKHGIEAARKYTAHDLDGALEEIEQADKSSVDVLRYLDDLSKS